MSVWDRVPKKFNLIFFQKIIFLYFLDRFDVLISKIIFKKIKKTSFWYISAWKVIWKATATTLPNTLNTHNNAHKGTTVFSNHFFLFIYFDFIYIFITIYEKTTMPLIYIYTHTHTYICVCIYICMYVCMFLSIKFQYIGIFVRPSRTLIDLKIQPKVK